MLKNLLENRFRIAIVIVLVFFLAAVRAFEDVLFYDPFLDYFKGDFTSQPLPSADVIKLSLNLLFRYVINTLFSLAIIYAIFENAELTKFSAALYVLLFVILMMLLYCAIAFGSDNKMILFYVRRFLIQPIFVLVFVPAFYFQRRVSQKNNIP